MHVADLKRTAKKPASELLKIEQVAERLAVSVGCLRAWRLRGEGPRTNRRQMTRNNHRPSTDQRGVKRRWAVARKSVLTCEDTKCPRQDSNLRHRL
jgi:hypothetical protein